LIALDTLTPERPRSLRIEGEAFGCPAHHRLLEAEVLIVENARLSADIPERGDVSILPLALAVGDGAPVRIVVKLPEPSRVL
jgi:kynurenine formamidase